MQKLTAHKYSGDDAKVKLSKIPVRKRKRCKKKSAKPLLGLSKRTQKRTPKSSISSTKGRSTILKCAKESRDIVYHKINATTSQDTFVYHTGNECYKNYTRRTTSTEVPVERSSEHEQLSANEET